MREIILDTETTGLDRKVDRICEIGCVEVVDMIPTGRTYHTYCNPLQPVSKGAYQVHGLSDVFLRTKPTFKRIHNRFLSFIEGAQLVAHNAGFDIPMINEELERLGLPALTNPIVDTLELAKKVHPRRRHTLDALCSLYNIDTSKRSEFHGALVDSELLAQVYVELQGGRQFGMQLNLLTEEEQTEQPKARQRPVPLPSRVTNEEIASHRAFVETLGDKAIWREYI